MRRRKNPDLPTAYEISRKNYVIIDLLRSKLKLFVSLNKEAIRGQEITLEAIRKDFSINTKKKQPLFNNNKHLKLHQVNALKENLKQEGHQCRESKPHNRFQVFIQKVKYYQMKK